MPCILLSGRQKYFMLLASRASQTGYPSGNLTRKFCECATFCSARRPTLCSLRYARLVLRSRAGNKHDDHYDHRRESHENAAKARIYSRRPRSTAGAVLRRSGYLQWTNNIIGFCILFPTPFPESLPSSPSPFQFAREWLWKISQTVLFPITSALPGACKTKRR